MADVGFSPSKIAKKETLEEAKMLVEPIKLMKVVDKAKHAYPKSLEYVYKFFFYCQAVSKHAKPGPETSKVKFFSKEVSQQVVNLSTPRNTRADLLDAFAFHKNPNLATHFD